MFFARWEAHRRGMRSIDSLHILLGISEDRKNRVNELFSLHDWYVRIAEQHCPFPEPQKSDQADLPLNETVRQILHNIVDPVKPQWIDSGDLLLALLREKKCLAGQILSEIAFDEKDVKEKLALHPRDYGPPPPAALSTKSEPTSTNSIGPFTRTQLLIAFLLLLALALALISSYIPQSQP